MARRYFGTDGVRGPVGEAITADLALRLGRALAAQSPADRPQVLIIRDTRESGPMIESALAAGIAEAGGDVYLGGVLPTPAASILCRHHGLDLAAVVSASHNPWSDNGIKFFSGQGRKLDDETEEAIESIIDRPPRAPHAGRIRPLKGALEDYLREIGSVFSLDLSGRKIILDCANGATVRAAPAAFERFGADLTIIANEPDGRNINENCGSTHIGKLAERVRESDAEMGFAFDGDGDRVLAVDRNGRILDGDELVALSALHLQAAGKLRGGVAVTVMTNYGFHNKMKESGIEVTTTKVGDRYVIEELVARDWSIGGEQSGHIIWTDFAPTGDGIAAALLAVEAMTALPGDEPAFHKLPQTLENVIVADLSAIEDAAGLWEAVEREGRALEGTGRVLVRPSGTEPLLRIMAEAPTEDECAAVVSRLADVARAELG